MSKKVHFKHLDLSTDFTQHFTGLMLGNGSLSNIRKSPKSAQLTLCNKHVDYIAYMEDIISAEGIEYTAYEGSKGSFPGSGENFRLETKFYVTFHELESMWYCYEDDGKRRKIVPDNFELTPIALLQWFLGDGYVVRLRGVPQRIMFCTDRYTTSEVDILCEKLYGLGVYAERINDRNRIRVPKRAMDAFYSIMPECPVDSLKYKWAYSV